MAKKIQIGFSSPVILIFSLVSIFVFFVNAAFFPLVDNLFSSNTMQTGLSPFSLINPLHYLKLFTLVLGHDSVTSLSFSIVILLLLGPRVEERFGSFLLILMFAIVSFVEGVIAAAFLSQSLFGSEGIAFLLIILTLFESASVKVIPVNLILVCVLYLTNGLMCSLEKGTFNFIVPILAGLCASVFGLCDYLEQKKKPKRKPRVVKKTE